MNKIEVAIHDQIIGIKNAQQNVMILQKQIEVREEILRGLERIKDNKSIPHEEANKPKLDVA